MQNPRPSIRGALTAAVCGLLGASAQAMTTLPPIDISSAALYYGESKRVTAVETVVSASAQMGGDRFVRGRFVYDALTGASANGAMPASGVQTFTRPSGRGSYQTAPGRIPLDDTFRDSRFAGSLGYDAPLGRLYRLSLDGNASTETDYRSIGLSSVLSRDFNLRNTTLTFGLSGSLDKVSPSGGPPDPLTQMRAPTGEGGGDDKEDDGGVSGGSKDKKVLDLLAGVTQVLNRSALMQVNYAYSRSTGYLTDPYKLLSVLHSSGADAGEPIAGTYLYEGRPAARTKQSLFWEGKYTPGSDVLMLSYRYMWDDWKIRSHTFDAHYRLPIGERTWVEPQARWYRQTAASFYRHFLLDTELDGARLPRHASADYRLGKMDTLTGGLKVGYALRDDREVTIRVEHYSQSGDRHPAEAFGALRNHDLFPTISAFIAQVGFSTHL